MKTLNCCATQLSQPKFQVICFHTYYNFLSLLSLTGLTGEKPSHKYIFGICFQRS